MRQFEEIKAGTGENTVAHGECGTVIGGYQEGSSFRQLCKEKANHQYPALEGGGDPLSNYLLAFINMV